MKSLFLAPIAAACCLLGASQAHAGVVTFLDFANGYQSVDISLSAPNVKLNETAAAGGLLASYNGAAAITTYCVDIYDAVTFNAAYANYTPIASSAHVFANSNANTDIGKLFAEGNLINNATSQAAFQIAIWEIAYETSGQYNLASGAAEFTGGTAASSGALALASTWLSELPQVTGSTRLEVFQSAANGTDVKRQDQVFAIPEPSSFALMFAGLASLGFVSRRRVAKAS